MRNEIISDVGVIVGRFQVNELHAGHTELIDYVCGRHPKVIIFLGLAPILGSISNPLDFESRKQMILDTYPNIIVLYIKDVNSDELWSHALDTQIEDMVTPNQTVTLYGGRDSFIAHYKGKFKTEELFQNSFISGVQIRKSISQSTKNSPEFRAGVIWSQFNRYPTVYATVDIAIIDKDRLLLGRKKNEDKFRFIGGFASVDSKDFESDAKREVMEETGVEVADLKYIGSTIINDWRFRNEVDCIKTLFFKATYVYGRPTAGDDIYEVRWFDLNKITKDDIMVNHQCLLEMLKIS